MASSTSSPGPLDDTAVRELRTLVPLSERCVYLNAGTFGAISTPAWEAQHAELERDLTSRLPPDDWQEQLHRSQHGARTAVAQLTGAQAGQVALQHTTHGGLNSCLWGIDWRPGDVVLTTDEEHPGLLHPLRVLHDRLGVAVETVAMQPASTFAERLRTACGDRTRVACISHVSWISGVVQDLRAVRDALPDHVRLIVDGAQGAAAMPVSLADGWDAYTVSGQKWPSAPSGCGAVVLREPTDWQPTFASFWTTIDPADPLRAPLQLDARRLEHSQETIAAHAGLRAALRFFEESVGGARVASQRSRHLNRLARSLLAGTALHCEPSGGAHLLCLRLEAPHAAELVRALQERGIIVRNLGDNILRLSLAWWNTEEDVERCISALGELARRR